MKICKIGPFLSEPRSSICKYVDKIWTKSTNSQDIKLKQNFDINQGP